MTQLESMLEAENKILHEIQSNLTAYASITGWKSLANTNVAYASCAITTGERMYKLFKEYEVKSVDELKNKNPEIVQKEIMGPNIVDGEVFAEQLRDCGRYDCVISPATFFAKGWAQEHYMSLWRRVIDTFVKAVHLKEGWEFSNGQAEEALIGFKGEKVMYEGLKGELTILETVKKLQQAVGFVMELGADAKQLYNVYRDMQLLAFTQKRTRK